MKELYLLRHGDIGRSNYYIGSTDLSLTPQGISDIKTVSGTFAQTSFDAVYCSPLKRCRETCSLLALPGNTIIDNNIREIDFGAWEGKQFSDIKDSDRALVDRWVRHPDKFTFPQGEALQGFHERMEDFHRILLNVKGEKILIITHGGVIRHLLCLLLRLPMSNYLLFSVRTGTYSTVALYSSGGVLTGLNLR